MFKANNKKPQITSLAVSVFVNFEHVSNSFLVYLLVTLNRKYLLERASQYSKLSTELVICKALFRIQSNI